MFLISVLANMAFAGPGWSPCVKSSGGGTGSYCTYDAASDYVGCTLYNHGAVTVTATGTDSAHWAIVVDEATGGFFQCTPVDYTAGAADGLASGLRIFASASSGPVTADYTHWPDAGGGPYRVTHVGSPGDDTVYGSAFRDFVDVDGATNEVYANGDDDKIISTVTGGVPTNWIEGGDGDDVVDLDGGCNNVIFGDDGADTIDASTFAACGGGSDYIDGGIGIDTITAYQGNDVLCGGAGTDFLSGGPGADWLYGGTQADTQDCGTGSDHNENDGVPTNCESNGVGIAYTTACPAIPTWP